MCEPDGNYSAPKRIDLYQLGLFNLRFRGYFHKDSVNLCPDITKKSALPVVLFHSAGSEIFIPLTNKYQRGNP
jgi:hypothetical protein